MTKPKFDSNDILSIKTDLKRSFSRSDIHLLGDYFGVPRDKLISVNDYYWILALLIYKNSNTINIVHARMPPQQIWTPTTINTINQIERYISAIKHERPEAKILCVFDWDNTLSKYDGCDSPLRDGAETRETLELLNNSGVNWFILTSRLNGKSIDEIAQLYDYKDVTEPVRKHIKNCVTGYTNNMINALPPLANANGLLSNPNEPTEISNTSIIYYRNIVYGENKGYILYKLMETGLLPDYDYMIFVDDKLYNVRTVYNKRGLLTDSGQTLLLLYYPQTPHLRCRNASDAEREMEYHYYPLDACLSGPV